MVGRLFVLLSARTVDVRYRLATKRRESERGSLTLEQAIVGGVLSTAAIGLGVLLVRAISNHSNGIN